MADDFGLYVTDMLRKNAKDYRVKRPPTTKAGKALHAVAAFFGAIARTVLRRKNAEAVRNFDVGSVLETFLREGEMFRNSTMANAEAARDARNRSTVVDEDGTEVAYHEAERGDKSNKKASELNSVPKHDGIGEDVLDALDVMLRTEGDTTIYTREFGDVLLPFGRFLNQVPGLKGKGFLHVLEERTRKDGLSVLEAIEVILKSVEAAVRGKENKALRQGVRHAIDLNGYRAIVADNGDFREFITGYKIFTNEEKEKRSGVETDAIRRSEDYNPAFYDRLRQEGAERLKERIAQLLAGRQVPKSIEELTQELEDLEVAYYRLLNAQKKAKENGASQEELDALQKDIDDNRAKYKQVAKAKKKLNQQRAKERKLYGDPNEERRDHIKVWSGAPMEFAVPSLAFVGTGTGGNNEGRGLYSSGVRGVAQDKYARGAIEDDEFITAWNKVVLDGVSMKQADAAKMIARKLSDGQALTLDEHVFHYYIWPKINPKRLGASEFTTREWLADDIRADFRLLDRIRKMTSLPTKRVNDKHAPGGVVEVYEPSEFGPSLPVEVVNKDIKKFEQKTHGLDPEKIKEQIERIFPDVLPAVMEQTWFTNRPEGDVSHLLNWFEAVTPEQMGWILDGARKAGFSEEEIAFLQRERIDDDDVLIEKGNRMPSGREMYMRLELIASVRKGGVAFSVVPLAQVYAEVVPLDLWTAHEEVMGDEGKFASEFFVSADIDGMMYPVDYRHGNRDGRVSGWNYVAFSDEHLRVDHVYEYNPETDDFERKWHEGVGSVPRFTETPLGQELVAKAFDVIVGVDADLLLRPWHYGEKRDPGKGLVTAGLGRELDMTEEKGFAAEVSARISRFGTREGDPTLREIRARCGSKERFYEVLGAVFETAVGLKEGVYDVITPREFKTMEKRMPLYAWVIRHNAQARATALGRKAYIMGREFAERLHREALAAARAEVERQRGKASEARAGRRAAEAQARNAERREETERHKRMRAEFSAAEADFIARWRLAEERAISRMRIENVREQMKESAVAFRVREAQKRAVERERGVSFQYLKGTLGVDIRAELRALAGKDGEPVEMAAELLRRIELGFDKWVREQRPELLENSGSYWQLLNEQGEKAYRETMGNVLKAVARELSYGKLREGILNAVDRFAHSKHETVHDAMEGKLARVIGLLRIAQNADVVALTRRRIKSALAEANKRLSSEASSARTRYMASMRRLCRELLDTFEDAVDAQGLGKPAEKKRQNLTALKHALESEIENINDGKSIEDLAKDETVTERQHKDAVKLMFLERFGDLSYDLDPEKVWAKAAEAEGFVRDALFEHVIAWEAKKQAASEMSAKLMDALPQARGWVKRGSVLFGALIPSWFDRMKWPLKTAAARSVIDEFERRFAQAATSEARAQTREAKAQTRNAERREETARIKLKKAKRSVKGGWRDPIVVRGQPL